MSFAASVALSLTSRISRIFSAEAELSNPKFCFGWGIRCILLLCLECRPGRTTFHPPPWHFDSLCFGLARRTDHYDGPVDGVLSSLILSLSSTCLRLRLHT
ncbi:hypothetical protein SISSUDRAFT_1133080 [Sistotremastrum suecicum HHB10207 ss-3]|uniref:Uncharacterized protein n=1 Tax=Sistotremastrum suecicum HHB10207 ss-3 TaxID=1314776 RepID=A0A165XVJ6_9AGAM|nr:hypothetical protein SISSUDRAFT_1133080 [Sistotremastrum suecicum HHB10207 ss-3]